MRIAVIGAGAAGLTCAKQALADGHDVVAYERHDELGGIWNPDAGGAYAGVRMQSSRMSMPFSDHPPDFTTAFPTQAEVHRYLRGYAERFRLREVIRFGRPVTEVVRDKDAWRVTAGAAGAAQHERFDAVMVASGELWTPRRPPGIPAPDTGVRVLTSQEFASPDAFRGERVLVVGGGVSGADIASALSTSADRVDWSVRRRALFLPRAADGVFNDALFSYAGRLAVEELPYAAYLDRLAAWAPDYMRMYRATGLLPTGGPHGAVHINDTIVPRVYEGRVRPVAAFAAFDPGDGSVRFTDGSRRRYDSVVLCLGYEPPDYGFLPGLRREDLYEHHFHRHDPTLAIVNTPVDTEAFGTACPYFETIAAWVLGVLSGKTALPGAAERAAWCERHMAALHRRRYLDCWLETVRIGLLAGVLPDPATDFSGYWTLVSSQVAPAHLRPETRRYVAAAHDAGLDLDAVRHRVLAALAPATRKRLRQAGQIDDADMLAAGRVPPGREIPPWLPYRQQLGAPHQEAAA